MLGIVPAQNLSKYHSVGTDGPDRSENESHTLTLVIRVMEICAQTDIGLAVSKLELWKSHDKPHAVRIHKRMIEIKAEGMTAHGQFAQKQINQRCVANQFVAGFYNTDDFFIVFSDDCLVICWKKGGFFVQIDNGVFVVVNGDLTFDNGETKGF